MNTLLEYNKPADGSNALLMLLDNVITLRRIDREGLTYSRGMRTVLREYLRTFPYRLLIHDEQVLVVNREYKPLGIRDFHLFVDYEKFQDAYLLLDEICYENAISHNPVRDDLFRRGINGAELYLYNDACPPYRSRQDLLQYEARLSVLVEKYGVEMLPKVRF